jgi:septum formation protein
MIQHTFQRARIILASGSPRRQYLLKELGLRFEIIPPDITEDYPGGFSPAEVARYLAEKKADSFDPSRLDETTVILSADTLVIFNGEILGKPSGHREAMQMLKKLSGNRHEVITGVCLRSLQKKTVFHVESAVYFKPLSDAEISYYIQHFRPFDKAGGYGVQEWIGYIGISKIEGSFFNIMGLPVKEVYEALLENYSYLC